MNKMILVLFCSFLSLALLSCGDSDSSNQVVNNYVLGSEVVSSAKDLPKCSSENDGFQYWVKDENLARVCIDGKWNTMGATAVDYDCKTKPLKDGSGIAVFCAGDSIGVVLNGHDGKDGAKGDKGEQGETGDDGDKGEKGGDGANGGNGPKGEDGKPGNDGEDGADGKDGVGCSILSQTLDGVTIKCGKDEFKLFIEEFDDEVLEECEEPDDVDCSRKVELIRISGASQKGPFTNGASVTAYELTNASLKQTGNSFVGSITSDDGLFDVSTVRLASQYVYLNADGFYRNEVTGKNSGSKINLRAIVNLLRAKKANINLVTHLEYDRVFNLVNNVVDPKTGKKMKVLAAKRKAESEIFNSFNIDDSKMTGRDLNKLEDFVYAEDMNILKKGDGNSALLAISILLQGDRSESELAELLADYSLDLADDGLWNSEKSMKIRGDIAYWAAWKDLHDSLNVFKNNVANWKLGEVPDFEKYIRTFWWNEYGLGDCNEDSIGIVKNATNCRGNAAKDCAESYSNTEHSLNRFICDAKEKRWRLATEEERDTYLWKCLDGKIVDAENVEYDLDAQVPGRVDVNRKYVCDEGSLKGVRSSIIDHRDGKQYKTVLIGKQWWLAENLNYPYNEAGAASYCYNDDEKNCEKYGRLYSWQAAVDAGGVFSDKMAGCFGYEPCDESGIVRGACPEGWHVPNMDEFRTMVDFVGKSGSANEMLKSISGWKNGNGVDSYGFNALPAGMALDGAFITIEEETCFWSVKQDCPYISVYDYEGEACVRAHYFAIRTGIYFSYDQKSYGFSVRCVRDTDWNP